MSEPKQERKELGRAALTKAASFFSPQTNSPMREERSSKGQALFRVNGADILQISRDTSSDKRGGDWGRG